MSTTKEMMLKLFDYNIWSFGKVWNCIDQLTDEEFCLESGFSHGSIRNQMIHVMSSTLRWIDRLQNRSPRPHLDNAAFPTIDVVKKAWSSFSSGFHDFIHSVSEDSLSIPLDWEITSRGLRSRNQQWEILLHVFNHLTDHRAQILAVLDLVIHKETVERDLIFFLTANE
jgi:uncharacterized damage-inducible protein DinB